MNNAPNDTPQTIPVAPTLQAVPNAASRPVILLAEDDRALRRYLEVTLGRAGFEVIAAADGLEAMKFVLSSNVEAVVTDANMPRLGGHELCRFLRRHPTLARLPIVFLSGAEEPAVRSDTAERADAYLSKPVSPDELSGCLLRLLARQAA